MTAIRSELVNYGLNKIMFDILKSYSYTVEDSLILLALIQLCVVLSSNIRLSVILTILKYTFKVVISQ